MKSRNWLVWKSQRFCSMLRFVKERNWREAQADLDLLLGRYKTFKHVEDMFNDL